MPLRLNGLQAVEENKKPRKRKCIAFLKGSISHKDARITGSVREFENFIEEEQ